jgi:transcriptional regulator with XRE-family HTH domain
MLAAMPGLQLRVAFLPFAQVIVKAAKPSSCPKHPTTLGQHLKKRRIELGLLQKEVAEQLGLDECTIGNWEKDRTYPAVRYLPRLIAYLGYDPFPKPQSIGDRLRAKRGSLGLSRKRLAALIGIDDGTLQRYEGGLWRPGPRNQAILESFLAGGKEALRVTASEANIGDATKDA